jgi:catechol 2,3-dioxygenase-like lactoylglutathione lyase family enzyme
VAQIDTGSGRARVVEPPTKEQGARRVWADSQGRLWVSEWNAGKLAAYDPMLRSMRLNHVALTVSDRDRAAEFYGEHFGLTTRLHDDEHLLILGSDSGAVLALTHGPPPDLPRSNHFGFQLATRDEVRDARARLRRAGVPEAEWQDSGGMVRVQVRDPDGYLVDLFAY